MGNADFFGHVSPSSARRGLFGVFYDLTPTPADQATVVKEDKDNGGFILLTTVCGEALREFGTMSDQDVVDLCVRTLQLMFPAEQVPPPLAYVVTRWGSNPLAMMSYSYVTVGASGEDYDAMATEEWEGKLLFAGEVYILGACG